jgi:D-3-phosphoglycerate dehydrogenase
VKILVVGDSYMRTELFERSLSQLEPDHAVRYVQVDETRVLEPTTPSELAIREYIGHPAELAELLDDEDALVVHGAPVTDQVLDASSRLSIVCCARGGPVNVDLAAATDRGIPVATTPGKNANAVADLTVGFLVMLARGISSAQDYLRNGGRPGESAFDGAQFFGHDLRGHTLGLVGCGQVGRRVAERVRPFGMTVLVHDPFLDDAPEGIVRVAELRELLTESDFVSAHVRASSETENMFDADAFAAMRPGSWFVNTARESLVDEEALENALREGHLAGAALDVVRPRAGGGLSPLLRLPQVIVTPHVGGATHETVREGADMLAAELQRVALGQPAVNVLNALALAER